MAHPDDDRDGLAGLGRRLRTRWLGRPLRHLASCGSTNDEAAAWARAGAPAGALVVADAQTGGRGRLGRAWHSPPSANLYLSVVLRPPIPPHRAPPLTLVAAVALAEAVEAEGAAPDLKWPNDLLLDGKKAAGILTEMATSGARIEHVVCGIGVNLNQEEFPAELAARATSLARAIAAGPARDGRTDGPLPCRVDRAGFAAALAGALERWYEVFVAEGAAPVVEAWKRRARMLGREVAVAGGAGAAEPIRGIAEDVDADGVLWVRVGSGALVRVIAGEVV